MKGKNYIEINFKISFVSQLHVLSKEDYHILQYLHPPSVFRDIIGFKNLLSIPIITSKELSTRAM